MFTCKLIPTAIPFTSKPLKKNCIVKKGTLKVVTIFKIRRISNLILFNQNILSALHELFVLPKINCASERNNEFQTFL